MHPLLQIMVDNEQIRAIKSEFFALRNGEIADRLRRAGSPYKIIFGLQLSQLDAMAARLQKSTELADALWQNTSTRESRLLAVLVYPLESLTRQVAADMLAQADTRELVDLLCFKLVRNLPDAEVLVGELCTTDVYAALRLAMNLLCLQKNICRGFKHGASSNKRGAQYAVLSGKERTVSDAASDREEK